MQGVSSRVKDCGSNLLMTPYGQAFLDSLIKRLPEAYLQSRDFWLRMFEPLTEWTASAILECCQQLGISERATTVNAGPIVRMFDTEPESFRRGRPTSPKEPWFMLVLKEASQILCQPARTTGSFPSWEAALFPLFPHNTMVMRSIRKVFDQELGEREASGPSASGEGTSLLPTSKEAKDGSNKGRALQVLADSPKGGPSASSALAAIEEWSSSSHSSSSEDLASAPDPSL